MDTIAMAFGYCVGILLGVTFYVGLMAFVIAVVYKLWKMISEGR